MVPGGQSVVTELVVLSVIVTLVVLARTRVFHTLLPDIFQIEAPP